MSEQTGISHKTDVCPGLRQVYYWAVSIILDYEQWWYAVQKELQIDLRYIENTPYATFHQGME
jgi:hypothetical protein